MSKNKCTVCRYVHILVHVFMLYQVQEKHRREFQSTSTRILTRTGIHDGTKYELYVECFPELRHRSAKFRIVFGELKFRRSIRHWYFAH